MADPTQPRDLSLLSEDGERMPILIAFFKGRTVAQLLTDLHFLSQYLIFRHHQESLSVEQRENGLYEAAKKTCHEFGFPWTDPHTGKTYAPPSKTGE